MMKLYNRNALAVAAVALLFGVATAASAGELIIGNATGQAGTNVTVSVSFAGDGTTEEWQGDFVFPAGINFVSAVATNGASCALQPSPPAAPNTVRTASPTGVGAPAPVAQTSYCDVTFDIPAGTAPGTFDLNVTGPVICFDGAGNDVSADCTGTDGVITVVLEGPPTITIDETPVVLPGAVFGTVTSDTIGVTVTPGGGTNPADTATYTCTAPAGFTVSPLTGGPIDNTGTLADIDVSCTTGAAAVSGNVLCTATNTAGSSVDFVTPVTCPAGTMAAPNLTPTPAAGGTVTVGAGAPGATACGTISIAASGGAGTDEATVTCTSGDVAVTVNPAGPLTFGVGAAPQTIQVCTTLTDTAQTFTDVIACTGDDGNGSIDWAPFSVAAAAGSTAPRFVPASSLWSKLALFGIFGALGMLIIGLRRSH